MKRSELDPLEPLVVHDHRVNEPAEIVVVGLQELNYLHLPHLLHLNVVKQFAAISLFRLILPFQARSGRSRSRSTVSIPLEDNNEEFAIFGLGNLDEKLDPSPLKFLD